MNNLKTLLTSLIVLLCTLTASAHNFEVDGIYYKITSSSDLTVSVTYQGSSYNSAVYSGSVVIPEKVTYDSKEYSVTSIGWYAFYGCSGLTSVTIPNSVTTIGSDAFSGCSGLTSITIPNSVTSIGSAAFNDCSSLKNLIIDDGEGTLTLMWNSETFSGIGEGLFYDCPIESLYIGRNLYYYPYEYDGYSPFFNLKNLSDVTIGDSVTSIGHYIFTGCSGLTSVTIPNSVTSIEGYAFYGCSSLTSITIPNSVTSIGGYAFAYCSGLTAVHITDLSAWCKITFERNTSNPTYYAHHLYLNGEEIKDLVIPDDVASIGVYAFGGCSGLTSVTIPNSVTTIGECAFDNCSGLTSVTIPNSVTSIGKRAFINCTKVRL